MGNKRINYKRIVRRFIIRLGYYSRPDFMIVGAQMAGTTGLYDNLNKHSKISSSKKKEIHYFGTDSKYDRKRLNEYHIFFNPPYTVPKGTQLFEARTCYMYHPEGAQRLFDYNPHLKLITRLRNPTKRAFSAWTMFHHHYSEVTLRRLYDPRIFSEAIHEELQRLEETDIRNDYLSYVKRGIYYPQVKSLMDTFSKENLLFMESGFLQKHHNVAVAKVLNFLGLPYEGLPQAESNKRKKMNRISFKRSCLCYKNFINHTIRLYTSYWVRNVIGIDDNHQRIPNGDKRRSALVFYLLF